MTTANDYSERLFEHRILTANSDLGWRKGTMIMRIGFNYEISLYEFTNEDYEDFFAFVKNAVAGKSCSYGFKYADNLDGKWHKLPEGRRCWETDKGILTAAVWDYGVLYDWCKIDLNNSTMSKRLLRIAKNVKRFRDKGVGADVEYS